MQWLSLLLLTSGCIIKQFEHSSGSSKSLVEGNSTVAQAKDAKMTSPSVVNVHLIWILVQVFCSCFAGVYNEYLLKSDRTTQVDVMLQNAFMYFDSILCNLLLLIYCDYQQPDLSALDKVSQTIRLIFSGKQVLIVLIILNNAAVGIVTSLFLKSMTSILKTFASALELLFTSLLAWVLFSIPVSSYTFLAIFVVSFAVYLYSINPVVNSPKPVDSNLLLDIEINSKNLETNVEQGRRLMV
jgi:solute carrier family 35 (UDP-sugar transporter), member A1/2/3